VRIPPDTAPAEAFSEDVARILERDMEHVGDRFAGALHRARDALSQLRAFAGAVGATSGMGERSPPRRPAAFSAASPLLSLDRALARPSPALFFALAQVAPSRTSGIVRGPPSSSPLAPATAGGRSVDGEGAAHGTRTESSAEAAGQATVDAGEEHMPGADVARRTERVPGRAVRFVGVVEG
jgi:hypothetical protein